MMRPKMRHLYSIKLPARSDPNYPPLFAEAVSIFNEIYEIMRDLDEKVHDGRTIFGLWFEISQEARGDHFYADAYKASKMCYFEMTPGK